MILSGDAIKERLRDGQIFRKDTYDEKYVEEASYVLRLAPDGMMLDGDRYRPGRNYPENCIEIAPGKIAILSTMERLNMPDDLVGKIGIRFNYAIQGLTTLIGIQVDPLFGSKQEDEPLYIRVANLGNNPVPICIGADIFTFELHQLDRKLSVDPKSRENMWPRIQDLLGDQENASWSYATRVQSELSEQASNLDKRLETETKNIRDYLQPVVMFGIFLIAVTILGVALTVIVTGSDLPEREVPLWVRDWGWKVLLGTLSFAASVTGMVGLIVVAGLGWRTFFKAR